MMYAQVVAFATQMAGWIEPVIGIVFGWGWLIILMLLLWVVWKVYLNLKMVEYVSAIPWTYLRVTLPDDSVQTPKAMENFYDVLGGMHKGGDLVEIFFEGYLEAWYSCELFCSRGQARYIVVVPTAHRAFMEGVIYGQYPSSEITEIEDYAQRYTWQDIERNFDLYGTEMTLVVPDYMPIKTYHEYEDAFAEDDKFIDPHQALVEAYTNIDEGEQFWVQILVRPVDAGLIQKWADKGEEEINTLAGKVSKKHLGFIGRFVQGLMEFPKEILKAAFQGPVQAYSGSSSREEFPKVSASDSAKMDGILRKISNGGFRTKIRILYLAPKGKLRKPNISRAIGAFKQFNTFHLNSLKPDPETKTNGPNYIMKDLRRYRRKRQIFLEYQWRDFFGRDSGFMMSAAELATIYHFPSRYVVAPGVERAKAGRGSAPEGVPYVE